MTGMLLRDGFSPTVQVIASASPPGLTGGSPTPPVRSEAERTHLPRSARVTSGHVGRRWPTRAREPDPSGCVEMALQEHYVVGGRRPSLRLERLNCAAESQTRVGPTEFHRRGSPPTPEAESDWTRPPPRVAVPRFVLRSASTDPTAGLWGCLVAGDCPSGPGVLGG